MSARVRSDRAAMETSLLAAIANNTQPQRYQASVGQFIRLADGRAVRLMNTDNSLTSAGSAYWRLAGIPAPRLYNYDQPLINEKWVMAYDGTRLKVRERTADGSWRITNKGEGYFRFNRAEYQVRVPYIKLIEGRFARPVAAVAAEWYLPLQDWFDPLAPRPQPMPTSVAHVREARERGRHLQSTPAQRLEEVRQSALAMLRDPTLSPANISQRYLRIDAGGQEYTELGVESEFSYLWDETRPLVIDQRRTSFWDDRSPTTEVILGRPLQAWALPDGMWRPFDMHPDTFKEFDHGCAVQMLYRSFTKRPSGSQQRQGIKEHAPVLSVAEIEAELDACFVELGYKNDVCPFEHGWRDDGVPASMVIQFCRRQASKGKPLKCQVFHNGHKVFELQPPEGISEKALMNAPTVAFQIFADHAYFFGSSGAKQAGSHNAVEAGCTRDEYTNRSVRDAFPHQELPPFSSWRNELEFKHGLADGFAGLAEEYASKKRRLNRNDSKELVMFWTRDLRAMLESARESQQKLKGSEKCFGIKLHYGNDPDQLVSISVSAKDCPIIRIKAVCEHAQLLDTIAEYSELSSLVYRGEGMASFGEHLRLALCKHRRDVPSWMKERILKKQDNTCAECGKPLEAVEFDHIQALADGGGHGQDNLRGICPPCHLEKTKAERLTTYDNAWYSVMQADTLDAMQATKIQQLVCGDGKANCLELDIRKCRRWAVEKAESPLPVACILDAIAPYSGEAADFVFVDAGPPDTKDYANFSVYQGPCWMTWELAAWGLEQGVCAAGGRLTEDHFIAVFQTSNHVAPCDIRAVYADMEGVVRSSINGWWFGESCPKDREDGFCKSLFLAMQGSWLTRHHYSWTCVDSNHADDAPGQITQFRDLDDGYGTIRWQCRSETLVNRSMYLWGLYSLNREHLLVAQAIALTKTIPRVHIHGLIVDSVLVTVDGKGAQEAKQQLKQGITTTTHIDGITKFHLKDKSQDGKPVTRAAPACEPLVKVVHRKASTWQPGHMDEDKFLLCKPSVAFGAWCENPWFAYERHWRIMAEEPGIGRGDDDTFQEEAVQAIADNGFQGYVAGRGGTGKSYLLKLLKAKAIVAGYTEGQMDVIAFTHVQASNVSGDTILHHLHSKGKCKRHLIIVDESSMVPLRLWGALAAFKFTGSRFVVLGDVDGQLPPIADRDREELWSRVDRSRFMHELVGGLRVELHKFRRGGDQAHFDLVGSIYPAMGLSLEEALAMVRMAYPVRLPETRVDTTLCVTNVCRMAVNARQNAHHAPVDAVLVNYEGKDEAAQDMRLWPGLVLQASVTDRKHLKNGLRYVVCTVTNETCSLVRVTDETCLLAKFELPTQSVPGLMRLTYAITYDSSQSRTLYGTVRLAQTDHSKMTLRKLIVGLGRAPEGSQLEVE